jgi:hypothetical protein
MAEIHNFTVSKVLVSCPGAKVELVRKRSGVVATRLEAKKNQMMALMGRANLFDFSKPLSEEDFNTSTSMGLDYDIMRMLFAIHSWEMPEEAFVVPIEDRTVVARDTIELLTESVYNEINLLITELWEPAPMTDDERKNEIKPSTSSPSQESTELSSTEKTTSNITDISTKTTS